MKNEKALIVESREGKFQEWTYDTLRRDSIRTACLLQKAFGSHLPKTDGEWCVILVLLPKVPEYWYVLLASLRLGLQFSPSTLQLSVSDIAYRIRQARPALIITDPTTTGKVDEALAQSGLGPDMHRIVVGPSCKNWLSFEQLFVQVQETEVENFKDRSCPAQTPAYVFFTSGTTGSPKMTVHCQASFAIGNYTSTK